MKINKIDKPLAQQPEHELQVTALQNKVEKLQMLNEELSIVNKQLRNEVNQLKEADVQLREREEFYRKLFVNNKAVQLLENHQPKDSFSCLTILIQIKKHRASRASSLSSTIKTIASWLGSIIIL